MTLFSVVMTEIVMELYAFCGIYPCANPRARNFYRCVENRLRSCFPVCIVLKIQFRALVGVTDLDTVLYVFVHQHQETWGIFQSTPAVIVPILSKKMLVNLVYVLLMSMQRAVRRFVTVDPCFLR